MAHHAIGFGISEVLSPSTASLDRVKKLAIYARERVAFAWLLDPVARTLEVMRLDGDAGYWVLLSAHSGSEVVRADPFTEIELPLVSIWADAS